MSISSVELWQRIAAEGLASPMQCRTWAAEAAQSLAAAEALDGLKVLHKLIELGRLTNYQAKILAGQSSGPLRRGAWHILGRVKEPLWAGWLEVTKVDLTKSDASPRVWANWLTVADLDALQHSLPALTRGIQMAEIGGDHLQTVYMPALSDGELEVQVAPVDGQLLSKQTKSPRSPAQCNLIVRQIAGALAHLHQSGVVHGRVLPDRIYCNGNEATLVRDPISVLTATLEPQALGVLGEQLGDWKAEQFLAPEFMAPSQLPSLRSDIFALGCTWWWMLTGHPPASGHNLQSVRAAHAGKLPPLPSDVALPEPLERVLKHCLARNPVARFASAIELCSALDRAAEVVRIGKNFVPANLPESSSSPAKGREVTASPPSRDQAIPDALPAKPIQAQLVESRPSKQTSNKQTSIAPLTAETVRGLAGQRSTNSSAMSRRGQRAKKSNKLMLAVGGGCAFLIILLLVLKFSGALQPSSGGKQTAYAPPAYLPPSVAPEPAPSDPMLELYQVVDSSSRELWAPPVVPKPIPLNMLPPGGQLFVSFRPASLLASKTKKQLVAELKPSVTRWMEAVAEQSGVALERIQQVTLSFYSPIDEGAMPQVALRIQLVAPQSLGSLRTAWANPSEKQIGDNALLVSTLGRAYFVDSQPLLDAQSVSSFSVGPIRLMEEVAEMSGAVTPLVPQVEKLWNASHDGSDLVLLFSPPFLLTNGRGILEAAPVRFQGIARDLVGKDLRAGLVQTQLEPAWYYELQLVGASDRDAGRILNTLETEIRALPSRIESWFVSQSPHPHWRALAIRFPQMLRTVAEYSRFGVEDGVAIMNAYLPVQASHNVLLSSWIALQNGATLSGDLVASNTPVPPEAKPLTVDEYLARSIKIRFDQEPIEVALRMIGDEANDNLPPGTQAMRFVLDGDAFEKSGITRNQQLRNFSIENKPMRDALTEVAKRGNPVTTVQQTTDLDQKLIWVVRDDPESPGKTMISLTTRAAATDAGIALPAEFAAAP